MSKVKVRVKKTFSTRDLKKFEPLLVSSKPVLYEGEIALLTPESKAYLDKYAPGVVERIVTAKGPEATKTDVPPPTDPTGDEDKGKEETPPVDPNQPPLFTDDQKKEEEKTPPAPATTPKKGDAKKK